ncbi:unnamed protein product [Xylocopa violacea]|uniref:DUF4789 domain-containing protein n=1 Tax=Xylocopa violacea TaxID=135666 RepID=A0ABP1NGL6_XYLVO
MRFLLAIVGLNFWIWCAFTYPTDGMNTILNPDFIYFPDQAEYVKLAVKCPENMILWPWTRRCYREGEQGPCNIGRILVLDRRHLKPVCEDEALQ